MILNHDTVTPLYPGGLVPISYFIVDQYGQRVNDYGSNISISFSNEDLSISSYVLIEEDGQCPLCDIGIYIQGITINDVNETFIITVNVDDDVLISNDIEIQIDLCPSGYGVLEWGQCSECSDGTYSINETAGECIECNEDVLEDIISVKYLSENDESWKISEFFEFA